MTSVRGDEDARGPARSIGAGGERLVASLVRPEILASMALLVLNDHALKWRWPGWVTGKLSDAAGLAFFPLLLAVAVAPLVPRQAARWREPRRLTAACALATAVLFTLVKCVPAVTEAYRVGLGALQWLVLRAPWSWLTGHDLGAPLRVMGVTDPSDLLALPFVLVSVRATSLPAPPGRPVH